MRQSIRKAISMILTAAIMLPGAGAVRAAETRTEYDENADPFVRSYEEDDDLLSAAGAGDVSKINKPRTSEGVSTWDCIWFGNYWQEDTNGDGHCFEKDTTVTKHEADDSHSKEYYTDQDGKELFGFEGFDGETKTYPADAKQPIKWRVLEIDEFGNALLLADKLIDIVQYNETFENVTWSDSTIRSYLNGYDDTQNKCGKDFSENSGNRSFVYSAFDKNEIKTISSNEVENSVNPVNDTPGGENTNDRIFCLSLAEAMNPDYGFMENEFTQPDWVDKKYFTDGDPTRVAVTTKFTEDKPDYYDDPAGESDWWWLRSPGIYSHDASFVHYDGAVYAYYYYVDFNNGCVRPAFRMNLSSSSSLWRYAGTVCSDGPDNEIGFVTGVTVSPKEKTIRVDGAVALSAKVKEFSNAPDKSVTWTSSDEGIATVDSSGIVTGVKAGTATITATTTEGGYTDTCKVIVAGPDMIADPSVTDGVTTWDCIWFGNYWQDDTNGDGHCFEKDTTVTKHEPDPENHHYSEYYTDQDGKELNGFKGEEKTYYADEKEPIKWRVLDIDGSGNALLLADKLIDIVQYNETQTDVTWETCTMRSYLNGYDDAQNICGKDFSENSGNRSFVYSAFDEEEIKTISSNEVVNPDNPVHGTPGGENTKDRIFCLSLAESMNPDYGFIKNEFTQPDDSDEKERTDDDPARVAVTTKFTDDKPGYDCYMAGNPGWWWLRSPGISSNNTSNVGQNGVAYAIGSNVNSIGYCVRPAFRMNLSSSSSLWRYAGTVCSDGSDNEIGFVTGVTVSPKEKTIRVGHTAPALSAEVRLPSAPDKSVIWTSSDEEVATVDSNGKVTGVKAGTATITATTTVGGYTDTCKVTVVGPDMIADPSVADGVSTWDCIWFGNYWQGDTNGDGHCFEKDTTVTKHDPDPENGHYSEYYTDQDGKELYGFVGEEKTYYADEKEPVKWRVLDIDDNGNSLLLADKLIDIVQYNETKTDVTWETCTMRSYLNGYDDTQNICGKDFSENSGNRSFLYSAFDDDEIKRLIESEVKNPNSTVYGTAGGNTTYDRLFCLSLDEAMNGDYGFIKNKFTKPSEAEKPWYTDDDPARVAVTTKFTDDKPGYDCYMAGNPGWWWLRSPGSLSYYASGVGSSGVAYADCGIVNNNSSCVRPAFRMNLSSSSSLWRYAGTVCSDGSDNEIGFVTGVTVSPKEKTIRVGHTAPALSAEIRLSSAPDKSVTWTSSDEEVATVDNSGIVTGVKAGTATITATTTEGGYTDTCKVTVVGPDMIADPSVADGVSTWDCIWFGNYWQDDTNGDGHCFEKDTTVTKHEPDQDHGTIYYTDQDGKELEGFEGFDGETKTYPADAKQPIKWRVLDIDEFGNALLLADKLIDIVQYNETDEDVTWSDSTIRSYLNGYDDTQNKCGKDFSENSGNMSFIYSAFDENEIKTISSNEVVNSNNTVYGTTGGENTNDRIFCLSLAEAMNPDNGFIENEFTKPNWENKKYYTDDDPARVAVTTKFTDDKPGYYGNTAGKSAWWWLRSPGYYSFTASDVDGHGAAYADDYDVDYYDNCVRPAFRMNLSSSSSLWRYAGTVSSNDKAVTEVYLPETSKVVVGKTITLTPVISPADATDQAVTWKSSAEGVATVSEKGVVTGVTEGNADITVTTHDGGFTATCRVTVSKEGPGPDPGPDTVSVNGVTLPATGSVKVGKTITLTPEISPADATDQAVTWKSSAEGVATVSTEGVVTGITEGTADITATTHDGGFTATCRVTVEPASPGPGPDPGPDPSEEDLEKDIDPDPEELDLHMLPGEVRRLKINRTGKYVYGVSYVSQDTKTVSVKNGVVTAKNLKKGETEKTVKVTATYNGKSADFTITVRAGTPGITPGEKGSKISAAKTVKADVGSFKTVTAAVKLPKALQGKEVRAKVVLPEDLPGTSVADGDTENDFFDLGEGKPDTKGTKVSFAITPKEAGAAYIVWTVTDDSGKESQAYTKVLIKKPLSALSANCPEEGLALGVGEGKRLTVTTTKGNTDTKDLSFSVKMKKGKGVKVSKSGFVTAASPDAEAEVTVKSGKVKKTVTVKVDPYSGNVLALNKTSLSAKRPKTGGKPKTVSLKISAPKKNPPAVIWSITSPPEEKDPEGITVKDGKVTVTADASPGCYTVTATPDDTSSGYNPACCEVIVR